MSDSAIRALGRGPNTQDLSNHDTARNATASGACATSACAAVMAATTSASSQERKKRVGLPPTRPKDDPEGLLTRERRGGRGEVSGVAGHA